VATKSDDILNTVEKTNPQNYPFKSEYQVIAFYLLKNPARATHQKAALEHAQAVREKFAQSKLTVLPTAAVAPVPVSPTAGVIVTTGGEV
jgi:hypothetical protein